jgi:hypothetical protein
MGDHVRPSLLLPRLGPTVVVGTLTQFQNA